MNIVPVILILRYLRPKLERKYTGQRYFRIMKGMSDMHYGILVKTMTRY